MPATSERIEIFLKHESILPFMGNTNLAQYSIRTISGKEGVFWEMQTYFPEMWNAWSYCWKCQLPAVSHRVNLAGQRARYTVAEALQQILQIVSLNCQTLVIILMLMMIIYRLKEDISFQKKMIMFLKAEKEFDEPNKMQVLVMKDGTLIPKINFLLRKDVENRGRCRERKRKR